MTFDLKLALICAQASNAAYAEDAPSRAALLAGTGLTEISYIVGDRDARALVCTHPLYDTILAFQGTQFTKGEIASIIENLETEPVNVGHGEVMSGYWEQVQALLPQIKDLKPQIKDLKPRVVTGHSMGGSIAHLYVNGVPAPSVDELVTFGAPCCADQAFWNDPQLLPIRFVRAHDFAPDWPPLGYDQPANDFIWLHNGVMTDTHSRPLWPLNDSVEDHASEKYVSDLLALTQGTAT